MSVIEFVGLGAMGWPMAQRLAAAGYRVRGRDASPDIQARWEGAYGVPCGPAGAVLCCVTDEAASRAVFESIFPHAPPGTLLIDHTSTSHAWARQADERARTAGLRWCDAPLSGGAAGAQRGELVVMLGAHACDLDGFRPLLAATSRDVVHLGPPGSGQLGKMANQLAIAGIAAGLVEMQAFSRAAGLDLGAVCRALLQGSARSVQLERLQGELALPGSDATEIFDWLRKDLAVCQLASARPLRLVRLWEQLGETAR